MSETISEVFHEIQPVDSVTIPSVVGSQPALATIPMAPSSSLENEQPLCPEFPSYSDSEQFWGHAHAISLHAAKRICRNELFDSHNSDDIASEVVRRLLTNPDNFVRLVENQGSSSAEKYITASVYNMLKDKYRRKVKIPIRSLDDPDYPLHNSLPSKAGPTPALLHEDTVRELQKTNRHKGDAAQLQAIVLHHALGYTHEEVAKIMGCADGTVKSRIHRGIKRLSAIPEIRNLFEQLIMADQA